LLNEYTVEMPVAKISMLKFGKIGKMHMGNLSSGVASVQKWTIWRNIDKNTADVSVFLFVNL